MSAVINTIFNIIFDGLLWPLQWLSPTLQIVLLGLPAAVFALIVFRYTSDQEGIEIAKDRIKAHLLELRLYKDDLLITLRAQGKILRHNLTYLRHALIPMAVMIVPFVLMIIQIESRFAYRSLAPEESAILTVRVDGEVPVSRFESALVLPDELLQETPVLRIDETAEIVWRLSGKSRGEYQVGVRVGETEVVKRFVVDGTSSKVSPAVYRSDNLNALLYPAESPLAGDSLVRMIHLAYPADRSTFAGLSSATWIFFGASLVFGFALRGPLGVTF